MTFTINENKTKIFYATRDINIRNIPGTENSKVIREVSNGKAAGYATGRTELIGNYLWFELYTDVLFPTRNLGWVRHDIVVDQYQALPGMIDSYLKKYAETIKKLQANPPKQTTTTSKTSTNTNTNSGNTNTNTVNPGNNKNSMAGLLIPAAIGVSLLLLMKE